eukprot:CAMPEP_0194266898 /NCGR_PEP_ID=MMETSP0169-20130528/1635_1 /TAXON_ID=218684 /ORGANISM="Corethron pennatum, Strain L29A3" /LENGTH=702 /DNA_ID=CAMNT_0039007673 /DNA_START=135 /DNA_END=2243 /DNA_ORIENTATION=-
MKSMQSSYFRYCPARRRLKWILGIGLINASSAQEVVYGTPLGKECPVGWVKVTSETDCYKAHRCGPRSIRDEYYPGDEYEAGWPSGCYSYEGYIYFNTYVGDREIQLHLENKLLCVLPTWSGCDFAAPTTDVPTIVTRMAYEIEGTGFSIADYISTISNDPVLSQVDAVETLLNQAASVNAAVESTLFGEATGFDFLTSLLNYNRTLFENYDYVSQPLQCSEEGRKLEGDAPDIADMLASVVELAQTIIELFLSSVIQYDKLNKDYPLYMGLLGEITCSYYAMSLAVVDIVKALSYYHTITVLDLSPFHGCVLNSMLTIYEKDVNFFPEIFSIPTVFDAAACTSAPITDATTTSAPTTLFNAQNFSISEPNVSFHDSGSDFFLNFTFVTGDSSDETSYTLYKENCTNTEDVLDILNIVHETKEEVDVLVDKKAIEGSSLVTQSAGLGYSKGIIKFCIKTEAILSSTSVAFRKTNVQLSYDLTENTFEVIENNISANDISEEEIKVSTAYGVEACICKENLQCETSSEDKDFEQNEMILICVYPNITSASSTEISNFYMNFNQNQQTTYTAVRNRDEGPFATAGLSYIEGNGDRFLVTSRLITALFEGGEDSFDVVGNAWLQFKTRRLKKVQNSSLRSMQENPIGTDAGESQFKMNIKTAKADGKVSSTNSDSTNGVMVTVVGGLVTLSILLALFKKMKKMNI